MKVDKWIKTKKNKKLHVQLQKDNGLWWTTKKSITLTNTKAKTFTVNAGEGNYRLVVYDAAERTPWDRPPLYYGKSTKYSGTITGL